MAPSCALLFLPFGLPMSIRCYGRVYLIPRLTLGSGKAVRSKLDCMHEPPVQPDYHVVPVTIILSPTRKGTTKRHWQQPLVTDSQNKEVLKCEVKYSYTVITNLVSVLCESQLPRFKELVAQRTLRKPPLVAVVFSLCDDESISLSSQRTALPLTKKNKICTYSEKTTD